MLLIFFSLLFVVFFGFIGILCLNYAIFVWENKKVNDLTDKIKPSNDIYNSSRKSAKNFTSLDLNSSLNSKKKRSIQAVNTMYERAVTTFQEQEIPSKFKQLLNTLKRITIRVIVGIKNLFLYLLSLVKPVSDVKTEVVPAEKEKEIDEVISKVSAINEDDKNKKEEVVQDVEYQPSTTEEVIKEEEDLATINFAATDSTKDKSQMTALERAESRILGKLKEDGLNDYKRWLELGNLYQKYEENKKATEIFALVLKHSDDPDIKKIATDKLVSLS